MGDLLQLDQPLLDGGIRSVNFFNGRLLAGKDLSREQEARRTSDWRLGEAIGHGVAFGLDIAPDPIESTKTNPPLPVLKVNAGLAINRHGQVLRLLDDTSVRLVRPPLSIPAAEQIFGACNFVPGQYIAGAGLYVLTIAPAEASEGSAPANGLDPLNVRCNTDATVEGVQFRFIPVKSTLYAGLDPATSNRFRNQLAYRCFGTAARTKWIATAFGPELDGYGLMHEMRSAGLTDCDVPLALVFMVGANSVLFLDPWAVRRMAHVEPERPSWMPLTASRRLAEGQAMFFQFQEQIAELAPARDLGSVTAASHFRYLPPVGIVPVKRDTDGSGAEAKKFFAGLKTRGPAFINAARLEALVRESAAYPPIDTASPEVFWLYRVRENAPARDPPPTTGPQQYIVFASGHMPYLGDARFDIAYWNNSNYALGR